MEPTSQQEIDRIVTAWQDDNRPPIRWSVNESPPTPFPVAPLEPEMMVYEVIDSEWSPQSAYEISPYGLDDERVEELAAGASPTSEELSWWEDEWNSQMEYCEILSLFKIRSSDGKLAWFYELQEGLSQGDLGGGGLFTDERLMFDSVAAEIKRWDSWAIWDGYSSPLIEAEFIEKCGPPIDGPW